jgi:GTPase SAR1 family protein
MSECLILGAEGTGKTLLLKKLVSKTSRTKTSTEPSAESTSQCDGISILPTIPTVGTNIEDLHLVKGISCKLREYGGSMAPLWNSAYNRCSMIVFVVDASNSTQISASTMLLLDVLTAKALEKKPVLIFFNKMDNLFGMSLVELKSVMRLGDVVRNATQKVQVVEGSCATEDGLDSILEWIMENAK